MNPKINKIGLMQEIRSLTDSIETLAQQKSLATLDHKIKQRQLLLEALFEHHVDVLTEDEINLLKTINESTSQLLTNMQSSKKMKSDEIIKHKNKGQRIRLYTNIAKQK